MARWVVPSHTTHTAWWPAGCTNPAWPSVHVQSPTQSMHRPRVDGALHDPYTPSAQLVVFHDALLSGAFPIDGCNAALAEQLVQAAGELC